MKADIPDKLTISRDNNGVLHHSYWTTDQQLTSFEDTEYIRKDALLEWLNEELQNAGPTTLVRHIINKLNSM